MNSAMSRFRRSTFSHKRRWDTFYLYTFLLFLVFLLCSTIVLPNLKSRRHHRVTFVTTMHKFESQPQLCTVGYLQLIAMKNWLQFANEVIVLVDDDHFCAEFRKISRRIICWKHDCLSVHYDKPSMSCLFMTTEWLASNDLIMFSNPDIIYEGIEDTVKSLTHQFDKFVAMGVRIDLDSIDLCKSQASLTPEGLLQARHSRGHLHEKWGIDYYLYAKGSLPVASMPPFIIGNWRWDNWLLDEIIRYDTAPAVDASETIVALHLEDTKISLQNRTAAKYNNDLWYAAAGWKRPDPFPAGLGDLAFAQYYTQKSRNGRVRVTLNHTALSAASPYVQKIA